MRILIFSLALSWSLSAAAFSTGAPICDVDADFANTRQAFHISFPFDESPGTFAITTSSGTYTPGQPLQVTLSAPTQTFLGVLMVAYQAGTQTRVGTFSVLPPFVAADNACTPSTSGITNNTSAAQRTLTVDWTPASDVGDVVFAAYIVAANDTMFRIVEDDLSAPLVTPVVTTGEGEGEGTAGEGEGTAGEGEGTAGEGEGTAGEGEGTAGEGEGTAGEGEGTAGEGEGTAGEGEGTAGEGEGAVGEGEGATAGEGEGAVGEGEGTAGEGEGVAGEGEGAAGEGEGAAGGEGEGARSPSGCGCGESGSDAAGAVVFVAFVALLRRRQLTR